MKQAFNPYLPSYEYVPDGEPHIFEGRLYVFGSHDGFDHDEFCLNDYVAYSAPLDDLGDWRYEGIIYKKTQDPDNKEGKSHMNAPDVCQGPDGRYYLYYQLHDKMYTSVAVAKQPQGPYEYYGKVHHKDGKAYGSKKKDSYNFDPGMLIDNGKVYMYTGFAVNAGFPWLYQIGMKIAGWNVKGGCCVELEEDMLTVKSQTYDLIPGEKKSKGTGYEGHAFFEASSPRKIGDTYYLVYSSHVSHELCYATAKSPVGPFKFGGVLVSNGDIGLDGIHRLEDARNYTGNTHGGLVEVNGQWYIFYHRQTNQKRCNRQGCAEKVFIEKDGSIKQAEMTSCGLNKGPLRAEGSYEARIACNLWNKNPSYAYNINTKGDLSEDPYFTQSGVDRESDGDQYIANMHDGAVCGFKYFDFSEKKPNEMSIRVRGKADGTICVYSDIHDKKPIATFRVSLNKTDEWTDVSGKFVSPDKVSALFFKYNGEGFIDFTEFTFGGC